MLECQRPNIQIKSNSRHVCNQNLKNHQSPVWESISGDITRSQRSCAYSYLLYSASLPAPDRAMASCLSPSGFFFLSLSLYPHPAFSLGVLVPLRKVPIFIYLSCRRTVVCKSAKTGEGRIRAWMLDHQCYNSKEENTMSFT